ncbi:hypothetical protein ENBRE01_1577 [Enteropsectra breve]|nr:hypothetical protein ENBRE01_1577 [Enteropsectra breve]
MKLAKNLAMGLVALVIAFALGFGTHKVLMENCKFKNTPSNTPQNILTEEPISPATPEENIPQSNGQTDPEIQQISSQLNEEEESSEDLEKEREELNEELSGISFEPLDIMSFDIFRNNYPVYSPMSMCMKFLLNCYTLYAILRENDFNADTQPFLRFLKTCAEGVRDQEIFDAAVNAESKCRPRNNTDFNDIVEFVIRNISAEDERVHQIFYNELTIKSADDNSVLATIESSTVNLNYAVEINLQNAENIEKICNKCLMQQALEQEKIEPPQPLTTISETKYSDVIVITTDRFMKTMRKRGIKHQSELIFENERQEISKFYLKSIFYEQDNGNDRFSTIEIAWLDVFDEDTREEWISKIQTNAIFLLYEREVE